MKSSKISDAVVRRLPIYLRYLQELQDSSVQTVSSQELGLKLDMNPAQIRKDLAYFGEFGRKGIGYEVPYLVEKIKGILKLDRTVHVVLIGAGHLGIALSNYNQFTKGKLSIVAIFDQDANKIGTSVGNLQIQPMNELNETVKQLSIRMGIVTVPAAQAQTVVDALVGAGVQGILNFAPVKLKVPAGVTLRTADLSSELQSLAYYME